MGSQSKIAKCHIVYTEEICQTKYYLKKHLGGISKYFPGIGGILVTFFVGTLGILGCLRVFGSTFLGYLWVYMYIWDVLGGCLIVNWSILVYFLGGILFSQKGGEQKDDNC